MRFIIALALLIVFVYTQNGVRVIVDSNGLGDACTRATKHVLKILKDTKIDNIAGKADAPVLGEIAYHLTDFKIIKAELGQVKVVTSAPNKFTASVTAASFGIHLKWMYRKTSFPHLSSDGTAEVRATAPNLSLTITVEAKEGRPKLHYVSANVHFNKFDIDLHGGGVVGWLVRLFQGVVENALKSSLEKAVRAEAEKAVNVRLQNLFNGLDLIRVFHPKEGVAIDLDISTPDEGISVTDKVTIGSNVATFRPHGKSDPPPFKPAPLPDVPLSKNYVTALITEYVANSAGWAMFESGYLQTTLEPSDVPPSSPIKLNTTSLKTYIPELAAKYPNLGVRIDTAATAYPRVQFTEKNVIATTNGTVMFSVYPGDGSVVKAFLLKAMIQGTVDSLGVISVDSGRSVNITSKIQTITANLELQESFIGEINVTKIQQIIQVVGLNGILKNLLNKKLTAGITVTPPKEAMIAISNPEIKLANGYIAATGVVDFDPHESDDDDDDDEAHLEGTKISQILEELRDLRQRVEKLEASQKDEL